MAAVSSGNVGRKALGDISNLPVQQLVQFGKLQSNTTKDYEQLLKEKLQLMRILADRERIIEVTGIELQKLRISQQKMQEQNKQLAQSNSHLLAEINASTEKVRALQHELGLKNGFLKALQHELKSQVEVNASEEEVKLTEMEGRGELASRGHAADKPDTSKRRIRSKSLGPSRQVQSKGNAGNKRTCVRQSARFKSGEAERTGDLCEIPETKCPPPTDSELEDGDGSTVIRVKDEDKEGNGCISNEQGRASMGRPSRVAAKKIQSYKEIPLNVKMRRSC